jgi:hypothetical protein
MTFQDTETYHWYTKSVQENSIVAMDPSELPDKVEEVKFWWGWEDSQKVFYAIGKWSRPGTRPFRESTSASLY